ncbi:hypothetical protein ACHAXS_004971 [Conticribra weissflogii]
MEKFNETSNETNSSVETIVFLLATAINKGRVCHGGLQRVERTSRRTHANRKCKCQLTIVGL